jgi:hypothetical protein
VAQQKAVVQNPPRPPQPRPVRPEPVFVPPPGWNVGGQSGIKTALSDDTYEEAFGRKDPSRFNFIEHRHGETAKEIMIKLLPLFNIPCPGFKVSTKIPNNAVGCFSKPDIIILASELDDGDYYNIVDTVAHELIHAWQAYYGYHDEGSWRCWRGHDTFFFIKALEVDVKLDGCLQLYPYCLPLYKEVTEGELKGLTPQQAWDKLYPSRSRVVINGNWI